MIDLEAFLRNRVRRARVSHAVGSVAALIFGIGALFVTFWIVYVIIWWGFQWFLPHSHQTRLICSGVFLVVLFIGHARTDREYLNTFEVDTVDGHAPYTISVPKVGIISNLNFFSPNTVNSLSKILAQLLFIGPQIVSASWRLGVRFVELSRIDVEPAARLVEQLRSSKGRVPFSEELVPLLGMEAMDSALHDLSMLDAVQFLESRPPGVMLTSTFRRAIES